MAEVELLRSLEGDPLVRIRGQKKITEVHYNKEMCRKAPYKLCSLLSCEGGLLLHTG